MHVNQSYIDQLFGSKFGTEINKITKDLFSRDLSFDNIPRISPDVEDRIKEVLSESFKSKEKIEKKYDNKTDSFFYGLEENKVQLFMIPISEDACELSLKNVIAINYKDYKKNTIYSNFREKYNSNDNCSSLLERVRVLGPSIEDLKDINDEITDILYTDKVYDRLKSKNEYRDALENDSNIIKKSIQSKITRTLNKHLISDKDTCNFHVSVRSNFMRLENDSIVDFSQIKDGNKFFKQVSEVFVKACKDLKEFFENSEKVKEMIKDFGVITPSHTSKKANLLMTKNLTETQKNESDEENIKTEDEDIEMLESKNKTYPQDAKEKQEKRTKDIIRVKAREDSEFSRRSPPYTPLRSDHPKDKIKPKPIQTNKKKRTRTSLPDMPHSAASNESQKRKVPSSSAPKYKPKKIRIEQNEQNFV